MGFEGEVWRVRLAPGGERTGARGAGGEQAGAREAGAQEAGAVGAGGAGAEIGEILIDDADFPWLSGRFAAGPDYAAVRDLFARELALAERGDAGHWEQWEAVCAEIERRVRLVSPDGPVAEFLLHIKGDRAWFRWSDEPFDRGPGESPDR